MIDTTKMKTPEATMEETDMATIPPVLRPSSSAKEIQTSKRTKERFLEHERNNTGTITKGELLLPTAVFHLIASEGDFKHKPKNLRGQLMHGFKTLYTPENYTFQAKSEKCQFPPITMIGQC